jgi:hypothetical protein
MLRSSDRVHPENNQRWRLTSDRRKGAPVARKMIVIARHPINQTPQNGRETVTATIAFTYSRACSPTVEGYCPLPG